MHDPQLRGSDQPPQSEPNRISEYSAETSSNCHHYASSLSEQACQGWKTDCASRTFKSVCQELHIGYVAEFNRGTQTV